MAKRKSSSGKGEAQYTITQLNLDKKGKTNKKLKSNPMASKYLTARGKEIMVYSNGLIIPEAEIVKFKRDKNHNK